MATKRKIGTIADLIFVASPKKRRLSRAQKIAQHLQHANEFAKNIEIRPSRMMDDSEQKYEVGAGVVGLC